MGTRFETHKRLITTVASGALIATLAGCGSAGPGQDPPVTTPAAAPASTPAPSTSPTPIAMPKGPIPASLVGTYTYTLGGVWHTTLRSDGTYAQWNPSGQLDITGRFGVTRRLAVFVDRMTSASTGAACAEPGAYSWMFSGKVLVMAVHHDDCTIGRIQQWTARWSKIGSATLRIAPTLAQARRR